MDFWRRLRGEAVGERRLVPAGSAGAELAVARSILATLSKVEQLQDALSGDA